jgi:hypothetical protein
VSVKATAFKASLVKTSTGTAESAIVLPRVLVPVTITNSSDFAGSALGAACEKLMVGKVVPAASRPSAKARPLAPKFSFSIVHPLIDPAQDHVELCDGCFPHFQIIQFTKYYLEFVGKLIILSRKGNVYDQ